MELHWFGFAANWSDFCTHVSYHYGSRLRLYFWSCGCKNYFCWGPNHLRQGGSSSRKESNYLFLWPFVWRFPLDGIAGRRQIGWSCRIGYTQSQCQARRFIHDYLYLRHYRQTERGDVDACQCTFQFDFCIPHHVSTFGDIQGVEFPSALPHFWAYRFVLFYVHGLFHLLCRKYGDHRRQLEGSTAASFQYGTTLVGKSVRQDCC